MLLLMFRLCAALGSILTLMGYDPQYRPPIHQTARAALGSIPFGAQKNIDPRDFCIGGGLYRPNIDPGSFFMFSKVGRGLYFCY